MKLEDYRKYYIQGSDHYLIPKDDFEELYNEMQNWKEENEKQKEINKKAIEYIKKEYDDYEKFEYGKAFKVNLLQILEDKEENVYEEDNDCGYYWWKIKSKEEILEDKEV